MDRGKALCAESGGKAICVLSLRTTAFLKIQVISPIKQIHGHKEKWKEQFGIVIDVAWIVDCEVADDLAQFAPQEQPNFVLSIHSRATVADVIDGGKDDLCVAAGDGRVKEAGRAKYGFIFFASIIGRTLE